MLTTGRETEERVLKETVKDEWAVQRIAESCPTQQEMLIWGKWFMCTTAETAFCKKWIQSWKCERTQWLISKFLLNIYDIPSKFINIPQAQMKISHKMNKTNTGCLLECASANFLSHAEYQLDLPGPRDILDILVFQVFWDLLDHLSQCDPSAIPWTCQENWQPVEISAEQQFVAEWNR